MGALGRIRISLTDNLKWRRDGIELAKIRGPKLSMPDNRLMEGESVRGSLVRAALSDPGVKALIPDN